MENIIILQNLTNAQLADYNNCSVSTIKRYLKNNHIKLDRYPLYEKYLELKKIKPHLNNVELSKELKCSLSSIGNFNKKSKLKSSFKYKYENFNLFEKSVLIGTLFGDSWLTKGSKNSYKGGFRHKETQLTYVKYKRKLLEKHCLEIYFYKTKKSVLVDNPTNQYGVNFKSNPYFYNLYKDLYCRDNKKGINKNTLKHFTDISLALYYQDDGSKITNKKKNWYTYKFSMYDYSQECIQTFIDFLKKKWNIDSYYSSNCVIISAKSRLKFKYLIKPYIVQTMLYKL